ncbi:MAG: hypothetical protein ACRD6X_19440 [Pyrinomonadaceae bacterium]
MSLHPKPFFDASYNSVHTIFFLFFIFATSAACQDIQVTIEVYSERPSVAKISGRFLKAEFAFKNRNLSLLRSYLGFDGLGERISDVELKDENDREVAFLTSAFGEYVAETPFTDWSYSVDLTPRKEQNAAAHLSWLTNDSGVLMLGDLLPKIGARDSRISVKSKLSLPQGWRAFSELSQDNLFESDDMDAGVIYVGRGLTIWPISTGNARLNFVRNGTWLFTDEELSNSAREIYSAYSNIFASDSTNDVQIAILKFPVATSHGVWQAETRGRNITIISSDMPFKTQSVQRLHEQLRHEIFHLWIPNGVNLSGNYDWFYEGFALYASLKMAVAMNRIRFEDFLDTLSRAQAIDARQSNRFSLIEASSKRRSGADTYIYARGMATAFLCDILLLDKSKGKRSVNDVLREFYKLHKYPKRRIDGNDAALEILRKNFEIRSIVEKYVNGSGVIEWRAETALAGLDSTNGLTVLPKLNGRQKEMLDRLGYNNWRRLSQSK